MYRDSTIARAHHDRKNCAIPFLHRDCSLPKVSGQVPGAASGNAYYHNCRAVRWHSACNQTIIMTDSLFFDIARDDSKFCYFILPWLCNYQNLQCTINCFHFTGTLRTLQHLTIYIIFSPDKWLLCRLYILTQYLSKRLYDK